MKNKRLRVLIIAHELSPIQGSECAEGWNLVTRLSEYHDITVLYASSSQFGNSSYLNAVNQVKDQLKTNIRFINIDQPSFTKFIAGINSRFKKFGAIGLPSLYFIGYNHWQRAAYKATKKLLKDQDFDIVHQLTQITFREPGYCWKLGIPFVWGPTGGTGILPSKYYKILSRRSRIMEYIRSLSNLYQYNLMPRVIKANRRAALIYGFSKEDVNKFRQRAKGEVKLLLDAGTYNYTRYPREESESGRLKGIWCGQLSERKAPSILLHALAKADITRQKIEFQIVGTGPLRDSMHELARELNLKNVTWIDKVEHDEIFRLMSQADVFVHTSLREATSNVIPEAISMGLPVICHDANGMSIAVNEKCGIKIPLVSPENSINGFHNALKTVIEDQVLLDRLKAGTLVRAKEISWDVMAESIANDYFEIVKKS